MATKKLARVGLLEAPTMAMDRVLRSSSRRAVGPGPFHWWAVRVFVPGAATVWTIPRARDLAALFGRLVGESLPSQREEQAWRAWLQRHVEPLRYHGLRTGQLPTASP